MLTPNPFDPSRQLFSSPIQYQNQNSRSKYFSPPPLKPSFSTAHSPKATFAREMLSANIFGAQGLRYEPAYMKDIREREQTANLYSEMGDFNYIHSNFERQASSSSKPYIPIDQFPAYESHVNRSEDFRIKSSVKVESRFIPTVVRIDEAVDLDRPGKYGSSFEESGGMNGSLQSQVSPKEPKSIYLQRKSKMYFLQRHSVEE